jgi:hypothetical protein
MANQWLNLYTDLTGVSTASGTVTVTESIDVHGRSVNLLETDRSGSVIISREGLASYGDPEVYLNIIFTNGTTRYLSAPLHTAFEIEEVRTLELCVTFLTGPAGTPYRALVNAHCIYQLLGWAVFNPTGPVVVVNP